MPTFPHYPSQVSPLSNGLPIPASYAVPRYRVRLVRDKKGHGHTAPILTSEEAANVLQPLFAHLDREQFVVCGLDAKNSVIGVNIVSIGTLNLSIVHPREVFKPLILMNAAGWVCAHNHPSGDPSPSQEDRSLTACLRTAADLMGILLLDHLIFGEESRFYSFADQGWPGS